MNEFYIGQRVFAEIKGQSVFLQKKESDGTVIETIAFDIGGIDILHRYMLAQRIPKESGQ